MHIDLEDTKIKELLKEILLENPSLLKKALQEYAKDHISDEEEHFKALLKNNFEKYDETFKALA